MPSFFVYLFGVILVAGALGYGAHLLGLSLQWVAVGIVVIFGLGLMGAAKKALNQDNTD